jgi:hypothetical protein
MIHTVRSQAAGLDCPVVYSWRFRAVPKSRGDWCDSYAALALTESAPASRVTRRWPLDYDAGSGIPDPEDAQPATTRNGPRLFGLCRAGFLENGDLSWFSRRMVNRRFQSLCARGLDRKF